MKARVAPGSCWALLVGAGAGRRLGHEEPKAFVPLGGRPLMQWSLETLAGFSWISDVQAVVPAGWIEEADRAMLEPGPATAAVQAGRSADSGPRARIHPALDGGDTRQVSVRIGLEAIAERVAPEDHARTLVLIHDAARPVLSQVVLRDLLIAVQAAAGGPEPAGVVPLLPEPDTLKRYQGDLAAAGAGHPVAVAETVAREGLARVQTPQAFLLEDILRAHRTAQEPAPDDAVLYERLGWRILGVRGSSLAIKVTYPEDLAFLEGWVVRQG